MWLLLDGCHSAHFRDIIKDRVKQSKYTTNSKVKKTKQGKVKDTQQIQIRTKVCNIQTLERHRIGEPKTG